MAETVCGSYSNSAAIWFWGYGWSCASTGGHCSECTTYGSGGYTVCVGDDDYRVCTDYQY